MLHHNDGGGCDRVNVDGTLARTGWEEGAGVLPHMGH